MSYATTIHRRSSKSYGKDIVLVFSSNMEMLCSSPVMKQLRSDEFKLGDLFNLYAISEKK